MQSNAGRGSLRWLLCSGSEAVRIGSLTAGAGRRLVSIGAVRSWSALGADRGEISAELIWGFLVLVRLEGASRQLQPI